MIELATIIEKAITIKKLNIANVVPMNERIVSIIVIPKNSAFKQPLLLPIGNINNQVEPTNRIMQVSPRYPVEINASA